MNVKKECGKVGNEVCPGSLKDKKAKIAGTISAITVLTYPLMRVTISHRLRKGGWRADSCPLPGKCFKCGR